jgi:hypothetical protein
MPLSRGSGAAGEVALFRCRRVPEDTVGMQLAGTADVHPGSHKGARLRHSRGRGRGPRKHCAKEWARSGTVRRNLAGGGPRARRRVTGISGDSLWRFPSQHIELVAQRQDLRLERSSLYARGIEFTIMTPSAVLSQTLPSCPPPFKNRARLPSDRAARSNPNQFAILLAPPPSTAFAKSP